MKEEERRNKAGVNVSALSTSLRLSLPGGPQETVRGYHSLGSSRSAQREQKRVCPEFTLCPCEVQLDQLSACKPFHSGERENLWVSIL